MDEPPSWERVKGESRQAYAGFACYRDLGDQRSNARVARELGKSKQLIDRWSSRHRWVERVTEYDAHLDRQRLLANEKARFTALARQARIAARMIGKVEEGLTTLDGSALKAAELSRLFATACHVERHALGADGDNSPAVPAARVEFVVVPPTACSVCHGESLRTNTSCPACGGSGWRDVEIAAKEPQKSTE